MNAGQRLHRATWIVLTVTGMLLLVIFNLMNVGVFDILPKLQTIIERRMELKSLPLFTGAELAYVKYGEGDEGQVGRLDQRYLQYIRSQVVKPIPGKPTIVPNLERITPNPLALEVDKLMKQRENGFFVECGAYDGVTGSNTLFFETRRNWSGLLIEANERLFRHLLTLNRKAFVFGGCLSPTNRPGQQLFQSADAQGGLVNQLTESLESHITSRNFEANSSVQCFPLSDILAALGVKRVDFLSLDVQGAEPAILRTINFKELRIDVLLIEVYEQHLSPRRELMLKMQNFFERTGMYRLVRKFDIDMLFERIDV